MPPPPGLPHTPNPTVGELYTHYRKQAQDQLTFQGRTRYYWRVARGGGGGVLKNARRLSLLLPLGAAGLLLLSRSALLL